MPERDKILAVLVEWVEKAEHDLTAGSHILKLGKKCPTDTVCFHAQQCVEKYLKAVLVLDQIPFPKTHSIEEIVALLPAGSEPSITVEEQRRLTRYATVTRYPAWRDIPLAEARRAVALARRVRGEIRRVLPREILRRKKR